jgi:hypothetical protein
VEPREDLEPSTSPLQKERSPSELTRLKLLEPSATNQSRVTSLPKKRLSHLTDDGNGAG